MTMTGICTCMARVSVNITFKEEEGGRRTNVILY